VAAAAAERKFSSFIIIISVKIVYRNVCGENADE
jgi:hypothetical protein